MASAQTFDEENPAESRRNTALRPCTEARGASGPSRLNATLPNLELGEEKEQSMYNSRKIEMSMGRGRPFPPPLPNPDQYLVDFEGPNDLTHPQNWSFASKLVISTIVCGGTFQASLASAMFAPAINAVGAEFGVGYEVGALGTTLFVLGFASGPVVWAPASEMVGRRWPMLLGLFGDSIFVLGSAVAKDVQTLIICRFFSGFFGASQLSIVPAILSDMYDNAVRGQAITIYALTVFVGPLAAPFIGAYITESSLGWRWTLYVPAILGFVDSLLMAAFGRESHAPVILSCKAVKLRTNTGIHAIHAAHDEVELDLRQIAHTNLIRPMKMLITEPVLLLVTLYMSFIYGLVYALVEAYPYIFVTTYHMQPGPAALPCVSFIVGIVSACCFILLQQPTYLRKLKVNHNVPIPEWRLGPPLIGAPVFAIGIFWLAWTGFTPTIHWIVPTIAGAFIGFGVLCIFLPCFNYIVDTYLPLAASAVAANIMMRSAVAAGFPLFTKQMFEHLGIQWAGTLLGCVAAVMVPIPFVFRRAGSELRRRSQLAVS